MCSRSYEPWSSDRHYQQISRARHGSEIARSRMTNRHRRISLQKQLRHRPANNLAATNDTCIRATYFNPAVVQQFDDACRACMARTPVFPSQLSGIHRMKTIDILRRIDRFDNRSLVNLPRQRKLRQNTVNIVARIQ